MPEPKEPRNSISLRSLLQIKAPELFEKKTSTKANQLRVKTAFAEIITSLQRWPKNQDFSKTANLEIILNTGSKLPIQLQFFRSPWVPTEEEKAIEYQQFNLQLIDPTTDRKTGVLSFAEINTRIMLLPQGKADHILITGFLSTRRDLEGNHLASSLFLLRPQMVYFAMRHMTIWQNLPVKDVISDTSQSTRLNRSEWTSKQARRLSYHPVGENIFSKRYR